MPYVEIYEKMGFIGPGVYNFSERFAKKLVRLGKGKYVQKEEKQAPETKEEKQAPKVTKKRTYKKKK